MQFQIDFMFFSSYYPLHSKLTTSSNIIQNTPTNQIAPITWPTLNSIQRRKKSRVLFPYRINKHIWGFLILNFDCKLTDTLSTPPDPAQILLILNYILFYSQKKIFLINAKTFKLSLLIINILLQTNLFFLIIQNWMILCFLEIFFIPAQFFYLW